MRLRRERMNDYEQQQQQEEEEEEELHRGLANKGCYTDCSTPRIPPSAPTWAD